MTRCPKCNEISNVNFSDVYRCPQCNLYFTDWQQSRIEELERENKILKLKCGNSLANNLCPDHRDKQAGKPCLACTLEELESRLREAEDTLMEIYTEDQWKSGVTVAQILADKEGGYAFNLAKCYFERKGA